jgi:hypothetical protein
VAHRQVVCHRKTKEDIEMRARSLRTLTAFAVLLAVSAASRAAHATEFDIAMEPLLAEYLRIQTSLAADSTEGVADAVRKIEELARKLDPAEAAVEHREHYESIPERIISACEMFSDPTDISSAREAFQELSKPVSMWVSMAKPEGKHVMYCSMKKAGWVQQGSEVANPYYGAEMLRCGTEVGGGQ